MAGKGKSTNETIQALREADVRTGQGETAGKIRLRTISVGSINISLKVTA